MADSNGTTRLWTFAITTAIVICATYAGFIWKVDARSMESDGLQNTKHDMLDSRVDKMESKYAEVNTHLAYIRDDVMEQRTLSKEILDEVREMRGGR